MNAVDAAVLLAAVLAVLIGWRVGLLQGFLGFLGFVAGLAVALWLVPAAAPDWRLSGWRIALVAALVLGLLNTLVRPVLILLTLPVTLSAQPGAVKGRRDIEFEIRTDGSDAVVVEESRFFGPVP